MKKVGWMVAIAISSCATIARAESSPSSAGTIEVSWKEPAHGGVRMSLPVPEDKGCSTIDVSDDGGGVSASLCHVGGDATAPTLQLKLDRAQRSPERNGATRITRLDVTRTFHRGTATPIGALSKDDHPLEVVATLR